VKLPDVGEQAQTQIDLRKLQIQKDNRRPKLRCPGKGRPAVHVVDNVKISGSFQKHPKPFAQRTNVYTVKPLPE
jgi:hypothetical protein